jgi:outer membrane protein TolC
VQQTLYDGGAVRAGKQVEASATEVSRQQVEVELNKLKEQVNQVYFYILIQQQQEKLFLMKSDELQQKMEVLQSALKNGIMLASDLDVFQAELLKVRQQIKETRINLVTGINVLEELTGSRIDTSIFFPLPELAFSGDDKINRPEMQLFDLQINNLDATKTLTGTQRLPKLFVFGQLGYGNPALNFFRDEFRTFYIVGAGLQWKLWDWNRNSRERELLSVQQDIIRTKKESFDLNTSVKLSSDMGEIRKFREAIDTDREIVMLREKIRKTAASQLENGVITATDYLTELNAETQARMTLAIHEIQMIQAQVDFMNTKGDL